MKFTKDDIESRHVRFVVYIPPNRDTNGTDYHYVVADYKLKNGESVTRASLVPNYERPVWVTKPNYRLHKEKREFDREEHLQKIMTTQSKMDRACAQALGNMSLANNPDNIRNSPYVYGYDISGATFIKAKSIADNKGVISRYSVAQLDLETRIATGEILLSTITYNKKALMTIHRSLVRNIPDVEARFKRAMDHYLPQYADVDVKLEIYDSEVDMISSTFKTANAWAPNFLSIWNINFDIPKILERLKLNNVNPIDVICDQDVPRHLRVCKYKQGIVKRAKASGKVSPVPPSLQWHSLISTSKFWCVCAMATYRHLRMAAQALPSYGLDAILKRTLKGRGKLNFKEADGYTKAKWHTFMQENYPIEYMVYNLYDCLGMAEVEAKTGDLGLSLPYNTLSTEFTKFSSNPKKIVDAEFEFAKERGWIIGTAPKFEEVVDEPPKHDEDDDYDEDEDAEDSVAKYKTLGLSDWIQLLPQCLLIHDGLRVIKGRSDLVTNLRGLVADFDSTSSYPSCTIIGNVSKTTNISEIIEVIGYRPATFKEANMGVCLGGVNLLDYFSTMFGMPSSDQLEDALDTYLEELGQ